MRSDLFLLAIAEIKIYNTSILRFIFHLNLEEEIQLPSAPKISIIIPLYNSQKFIGTCIDSILRQTFQDFEIIVVDDASRDGGLQFCGQRYQNEPRVKILQHSRNRGECAARNAGLSAAKGKYIYFMDDDDALMPRALEVFYSVAEQSNAEVVHMTRWVDAQDENFTLSSKLRVKQRGEKDPSQRMLTQNLHERLLKEFIDSGTYVTPWLNFFRHDFLYRNGIYFPNTTRQSDVLHTFAALCLAKSFAKIDAGFYIRRIGNRSNELNASPEKHLRESLKSLPEMIKYMEEIFAKDLVSQLPRREQLQLEVNVIQMTMDSFVVQAYRKNIELEIIDRIVAEEIAKHSINNPQFVRIMFHALAFSNIARTLMAQRSMVLERQLRGGVNG